MENDGKRIVHERDVGISLPRKIKRKEKVREDAENERQTGMQSQWQHESPAREFLERVKCCSDTDCTHRMMKTSSPCVERRGLGRFTKAFSELK